MSYPWQAKQWQQLWQMKLENRLPHALLFSGIAGIGKAKFADYFSRAMLCQQVTAAGEYCGTCHACRLVEGRAHPNLMWIEPEKAGQAIKVDQIREVIDFVNQSSLQGEYRFVIINPANAMNISAANALLKTLEEPSSGAVLVLVSDQSERMPATILSRCQRIAFPRPSTQEASNWLHNELPNDAANIDLLLSLTNGAPLAARQMVQDEVLALRKQLLDVLCTLSRKQSDPLKSAASLQEMEPLQILDFTLSWVKDLLSLQLSGAHENVINKDFNQALIELQQKTHLKKSTQFMEFLLHLRRQLCHGMNFNKQLMTESILVRWMECVTCF